MNNDLTFKTTFSNQEAIEFGYVVKDLIEPLIESHEKLFFEQANCYTSCFYHARRLLTQVKSTHYIHEPLREFFFNGYELDNSEDRLSWDKDKPEEEEEAGDCPF